MARPTPSELRALRRRDPRLAAAMDRLPAFPGFPDDVGGAPANHWHALARAIVFQQLATAAATTIHRRVCALTPGDSLAEPEEFLTLDTLRLRAAGLSANKLEALRDLAGRIRDGRLPLHDLHEVEDDEVVARLVAVRGIGEWSAHMFLLFRLGRLDVGASGDLGVREGLRLLDRAAERPTPRAALARMEAWRPLRSVGSWLMWRLVDEERAATAAEPASARAKSVAAARSKTASASVAAPRSKATPDRPKGAARGARASKLKGASASRPSTPRTTATRNTATRSTATRATATRSTAKRSTATRSTAKRSTATRSTATRATAMRTTTKRNSTVRKTTAGTSPARSPNARKRASRRA